VFIRNTSPRSARGTRTLNIDCCICSKLIVEAWMNAKARIRGRVQTRIVNLSSLNRATAVPVKLHTIWPRVYLCETKTYVNACSSRGHPREARSG
jgi:hypothetical protein